MIFSILNKLKCHTPLKVDYLYTCSKNLPNSIRYSLIVKEWMKRVIIVSRKKSEILLFSSETSSILTRTEWTHSFFPLLQSGHSYRSFQSEFFYVYWNLSLFALKERSFIPLCKKSGKINSFGEWMSLFSSEISLCPSENGWGFTWKE